MKIILSTVFLFSIYIFKSHSDSITADKHPLIKFLFGDTGNNNPDLISLNISQTAFSDWQGVGDNNFSIISLLKYHRIYKKEKYEFYNKMHILL